MTSEKKTGHIIRFCLFSILTFFLVFTQHTKPAAAANTVRITAEFTTDGRYQIIPITVTASSTTTVQTLEYASGRVANTSYFTTHAEKCTKITKDSSGNYTFTVAKNGYYSIHAKDATGGEGLLVIKVNNIYLDTEAPELSFRTIYIGSTGKKFGVTVTAKDDSTEPVSIKYVTGSFPSETDAAWKNAKEITSGKEVTLFAEKYTFMATDAAGNKTIIVRRIGDTGKDKEFRAVWIAYYDFKSTGYTEKEFRTHVGNMFNEVAGMNMNAVVVHVRPFSDAMYPSKYFPWSKYCSGTQGKDPGFDPLKIMIDEAHARGLEFHAWLNPYRVSNTTTDITTLSKDNPARVYRTDSTKSNDRNVLTFDGKLYYNPASAEVQKLIVNGIKEIVENYKVDGIHFDDYFYPSLGKNYKTNFDAPEYETYKKKQIAANKSYLSIADWRRENVNNLVRTIYSTIKSINPKVVYGISPGGFMNALRADDKYYVDFDTWVSYDGYIDYLCPQLYWSNDHSIYPFDDILERFSKAMKNPDVKLYVGVGAYKAGITTEGNDWYKNPDVLKNMIIKGRNTKNVNGFVLFDYSHIISKRNKAAIKNMLNEFK